MPEVLEPRDLRVAGWPVPVRCPVCGAYPQAVHLTSETESGWTWWCLIRSRTPHEAAAHMLAAALHLPSPSEVSCKTPSTM